MGQSLVQIYVHIVFSTKGRKPFLKDDQFRDRLHGYLAGSVRGLNCVTVKVGGVEDHVHLLVRLGKQVEVSSLVRDLKRESSKWIKQENSTLTEFHWQSGYGAFSVSPSHVPTLSSYVEHQVEHHRTESFREEFRRICQKYGIEIDERYAWD